MAFRRSIYYLMSTVMSILLAFSRTKIHIFYPKVVNSQQKSSRTKDFLLFVKAGANSGPILLIFWGPSHLSPSPMLTPSFS